MKPRPARYSRKSMVPQVGVLLSLSLTTARAPGVWQQVREDLSTSRETFRFLNPFLYASSSPAEDAFVEPEDIVFDLRPRSRGAVRATFRKVERDAFVFHDDDEEL